MIEVKCKKCNISFMIKPYRLLSNTDFYCSKLCYNNRNKILKQCQYCLNKFITISFGKNSKKFCSAICYHQYKVKENHPSWKGGYSEIICKYCNKKFFVKPYQKDNAKYCSTVCCNKDTKLIGNKNPAWKGGVTSINEKIRKSDDYQNWRNFILKRDNYTCQLCFSKKDLNAHHIKRYCDFQDLRFDLNNGICLCKNCHQQKINRHELEYEAIFMKIIKQKIEHAIS